jgi:hypothetical protein
MFHTALTELAEVTAAGDRPSGETGGKPKTICQLSELLKNTLKRLDFMNAKLYSRVVPILASVHGSRSRRGRELILVLGAAILFFSASSYGVIG